MRSAPALQERGWGSMVLPKGKDKSGFVLSLLRSKVDCCDD